MHATTRGEKVKDRVIILNNMKWSYYFKAYFFLPIGQSNIFFNIKASFQIESVGMSGSISENQIAVIKF